MLIFPSFFLSFFWLGFFDFFPSCAGWCRKITELVRCTKYQWLHKPFQYWWILSNVRGENLARGRITDDCSYLSMVSEGEDDFSLA